MGAKNGDGKDAGTATAGEPRFDELLTRLRGLVEKLEGGNLPLEDSLQYFEEGMDLCRRGSSVLDQAEKKVEMLLSGPDKPTRTAPFDAGDGGSEL